MMRNRYSPFEPSLFISRDQSGFVQIIASAALAVSDIGRSVRLQTATLYRTLRLPIMPRFYFHIRDGETLIEDPDGSELPDLEAARVEALEGARTILAEKVKAGAVVDGQRFEIVDESGAVRATLPFRAAIRLA